MSVITNPNYDDANTGTLQGVINQALRQALVNLEDMLPAIVVGYDRAGNVATVQPSIMMVGTDGSTLSRAPLASVPVFAYGSADFTINFPLTAGARGWIKACDRDISLYLQSGANTAPNTRRVHSFSDGVFFPDSVVGFTIDGEDTNNAVFQTKDGTYRVALWADRVKVTCPAGSFECMNDRIRVTSSRFDINSGTINFASNPHVGPIPP